jgi:hypothetical protein
VEKFDLAQADIIPRMILDPSAQNDMVEHLNFEKLASPDEVARHAVVRLARRWTRG